MVVVNIDDGGGRTDGSCLYVAIAVLMWQILRVWRDRLLVHGDVKPANIVVRVSTLDPALDDDVRLPDISTYLIDLGGVLHLRGDVHSESSSSSSSDEPSAVGE